MFQSETLRAAKRMWRSSGGLHARRQKAGYFLAGALFALALQSFGRLSTRTNAAVTPHAPCTCPVCAPDDSLTAHAVLGRDSPRPISVVTVFSTEDAWLDDASGRLGFQRGLGGWSKYTYLQGYTFRPYFFVPAGGERLNWNRVQAALDECRSGAPWVMWTESDVWVTNFHKRIEDVLDFALQLNPETVFVLNNDAIGNLNAGSGFVRCSERGKEGLQKILRIRTENAEDVSVRAWDANGAFIVLSRDERWKPFITFVPAKLYNAYPVHVPEWTHVQQSEDAGYWSHGDWLIHFAGFFRGGMFSFARANASELVVGEPAFITMYDKR